MSRYFLTAIEIEGFRGINNEGDALSLRFEKDAVNSVFAPNAQGKSSIFEALCYAIKGKVPKLEAMPATDRPEDYYANRFHTNRTATVQATFCPDDDGSPVKVKVQRLPNGTRRVESPSGHANPEGFLQSLNTELCLVDHRTFLSFVEDSPLKRGRSFAGLLGIGKLSEFRQALEILANSGTLTRDFELSEIAQRLSAAQHRVNSARNRIKASFLTIANVSLEDELDLDQIAAEAARILEEVALLKPFLAERNIREVNWDKLRGAIRRRSRVTSSLGWQSSFGQLMLWMDLRLHPTKRLVFRHSSRPWLNEKQL
jgi:DNA repair exonuclease SbcCD ATPase subunit